MGNIDTTYLNMKFEADTRQLKNALEQVGVDTKKLVEDAKKLAVELDKALKINAEPEEFNRIRDAVKEIYGEIRKAEGGIFSKGGLANANDVAALGRAKSELDDVVKGIDKAAQGAKKFTDETSKAKDPLEKAAKAADDVADAAKGADKSFKGTADEAEQVSAQVYLINSRINPLVKKAEELQKELRLGVTPMERLKKEAADTGKALELPARPLQKVVDDAAKLQHEIKKVIDIAEEAGGVTEFGKISDDFQKLLTSSNDLQRNTRAANSALKDLENQGGHTAAALNFLLGAGMYRIGRDLYNVLSSAVGDLVKGSIDLYDAQINFQRSVKAQGWGVKETESLYRGLKEYADVSIYGLESVLKLAQKLAGVGERDLVGTTKAIGNAVRLFGGTEDSFNGIALALTQISGRGKLTADNFRQIAENSPGLANNVKKLLIESGKFGDNWENAMRLGKISAEDFNNAVKQIGTSDIAVEAGTAIDTFAAAAENAQARILNALEGPFRDVQEGLIKFLTTLPDKVGPPIAAITKIVGPMIKLMADPKVFGFAAMLTAGTVVASAWKAVTDKVEGGLSVLDRIRGVFKELGNSAKEAFAASELSFGRDLGKKAKEAGEEAAENVVEGLADMPKGVEGAVNQTSSKLSKLPVSAQKVVSGFKGLGGIGKTILSAIGPIGLITIALAGITTVISAVNEAREKAFVKSDWGQRATKYIDSADKKLDGLTTRLDDVRSRVGVSDDIGGYQRIMESANSIVELQQAYSDGKISVDLLKEAVQELNDEYPELGVSLDEATGKLMRNGEEVTNVKEELKKLGTEVRYNQIKEGINGIATELDKLKTETTIAQGEMETGFMALFPDISKISGLKALSYITDEQREGFKAFETAIRSNNSEAALAILAADESLVRIIKQGMSKSQKEILDNAITQSKTFLAKWDEINEAEATNMAEHSFMDKVSAMLDSTKKEKLQNIWVNFKDANFGVPQDILKKWTDDIENAPDTLEVAVKDAFKGMLGDGVVSELSSGMKEKIAAMVADGMLSKEEAAELTKMTEVLNGLENFLKSGGKEQWTKIKAVIKKRFGGELPDSIKDAFATGRINEEDVKSLLTGIGGYFTKNKAADLVPDGWTESMWTKLVDGLITGKAEFEGKTYESMGIFGEQIMLATSQGILQGKVSVDEAMNSMAALMTLDNRGVISELYTNGDESIRGLLDGIIASVQTNGYVPFDQMQKLLANETLKQSIRKYAATDGGEFNKKLIETILNLPGLTDQQKKDLLNGLGPVDQVFSSEAGKIGEKAGDAMVEAYKRVAAKKLRETTFKNPFGSIRWPGGKMYSAPLGFTPILPNPSQNSGSQTPALLDGEVAPAPQPPSLAPAGGVQGFTPLADMFTKSTSSIGETIESAFRRLQLPSSLTTINNIVTNENTYNVTFNITEAQRGKVTAEEVLRLLDKVTINRR